MKPKQHSFIPVLSSQAGSCLSVANWQQAGIKQGVYYLEALLSKPGIEVLREFKNLRDYCAWTGMLLINADSGAVSKSGEYCVRSPYDGSTVRLSKQALFEFVDHLQADYVIWPKSLAEEARIGVSDAIFLVPGTNQVAGQALSYKIDKTSLDQPLSLIPPDALEVIWFESDRPALDAMQGRIYSQLGIYNVLDSKYQQDFQALNEDCACSTCQQGLTRAYLHHLLQQTPLLAQRFLIMHNIHYYLNLPSAKFSL